MPVLLKEYSQLNLNEEKLQELKMADAQGKPVIVIGVIQRADAKNANGRIYPYNILRKEVDRYNDEVVCKGSAIGQLDHIDSPVIELKDVSHIIRKVWWDGPDKKDVYGEIQLLNTPRGNIAKEIVLQGIPLGISSRAVGSIMKSESQGADVVQEDLNIVCWDLVGVPSTQGALLSLRETKEIKNFDKEKALPAQYRVKTILEDILRKK